MPFYLSLKSGFYIISLCCNGIVESHKFVSFMLDIYELLHSFESFLAKLFSFCLSDISFHMSVILYLMSGIDCPFDLVEQCFLFFDY